MPAEPSLCIQMLAVRSFRNLSRVDIEPSAGFNVISGDNGQGKTSLLEAVYVLATSKSFRTSRPLEIVQFGAVDATVRATVLEGGLPREQSVGLGKGMRAVRVDGKRPATLASYATRTPAVVFHPGALTLSSGGGTDRRKLLDRVALYADASPGAPAAYAQAQRSRQRVLETRGEKSPDLDGWEELMVQHGLALSSARDVATGLIAPEAEAAFVRIGSPGGALRVSYVRSAPVEPAAFRDELARNRARDRARRSPSVGPHRDDLLLELGGHGARISASQGQHRAIVLALHLAEIEVVCRLRGSRPILLLDDVSSELDRQRTAALFAALRAQQGQVLLTTTRPDLIEPGAFSASAERRDYVVNGGQITLAS
ncbi:MAG: DNA replication/repair protein RecF [Polyangiaceae bacterium]